MVKLLLYSELKDQSTELADGSTTVIGRGFAEVADKRVSRKHGEIKVIHDKIQLKACHVNPIFYKTNDSNLIQILTKDNEVTLGNLDKFCLLPNNEIEYEIKVVRDPEDNNGHVAAVEPPSGGFECEIL